MFHYIRIEMAKQARSNRLPAVNWNRHDRLRKARPGPVKGSMTLTGPVKMRARLQAWLRAGYATFFEIFKFLKIKPLCDRL